MTHTSHPTGADPSPLSDRGEIIWRRTAEVVMTLAILFSLGVIVLSFNYGEPWTVLGWNAEIALIVTFVATSGLAIAIGFIAALAADRNPLPDAEDQPAETCHACGQTLPTTAGDVGRGAAR